jgi:hypothetical protein
VTPISLEEFHDLTTSFERGFVHLETRDTYGTEVEQPQIAKWRAGEPDDLAWMRDWCDNLRRKAAAGASMRRAHIVSEPLSEYQRWVHGITGPMVDAGEDIAWVPRRLVSTIAIPGNDYYLLDDLRVVFLVYTGDGLNKEFQLYTDPEVVQLCRTAFEAVWGHAIPHRDYRPDE